MKVQNIAMDINKLNTEDLKILVEMFYKLGEMEKVQQINNRIAFVEGWMSPAKEAEYIENYC